MVGTLVGGGRYLVGRTETVGTGVVFGMLVGSGVAVAVGSGGRVGVLFSPMTCFCMDASPAGFADSAASKRA